MLASLGDVVLRASFIVVVIVPKRHMPYCAPALFVFDALPQQVDKYVVPPRAMAICGELAAPRFHYVAKGLRGELTAPLRRAGLRQDAAHAADTVSITNCLQPKRRSTGRKPH